MNFLFRIACLAAVTAALCWPAERFEVRYFFDEDESALSFTQIVFPSAKRGIAPAVQVEDRRARGVLLLTSDGGATWSRQPFDDLPVSIFCLDETACWIVGAEGIWFSEEGGRQWKRVEGEQGLRQVRFINRQRGFAVGERKKLLETRDGGKTWTKMAVAAQLAERSDRLTFGTIEFITPKFGMILGRSEPADFERTPSWLRSEPEDNREHPTLSIAMETRDGGETWNVAASSMFGRMTRFRPGLQPTQALALVEFDRFFEYPSEVFRADFLKGTNERVLRTPDFAATDIGVVAGGIALAAGFQPPGKLARTPVPGKVRVLRSASDLKIWRDIPVDYRAVANRVHMAVAPDQSVWLATDEGMILRLVP